LIRWFLAVGYFVTGIVVGAVLLAVLVLWGDFSVDRRMPIVDLGQLAATLFLALYIPFAVDRYRDRARSVRALLLDDVRSFMTIVGDVNKVMTSCSNSSKTMPQDLMRIRSGFLSANVKIARLEGRLVNACGKGCRPSLDPFKQAYLKYWDAVTSGSLYGGTPIDWDLWRKQEFAYASLEHAAAELLRYLTAN
jgi:hypothetical protein